MIKLVAILIVAASCGFPRPADVTPGDDAGGDSGASVCQRDEDCHDAARPACVSGQCFSAADACREGGGARILFVSNRDGSPDVFRAYANGSTPVHLTSYDPPHDITAVAPAPSGKAIAFILDHDVAVMGADGSNPQNITNSAALEDRFEWSPDSKMLAVGTTATGGTPGAYIMNADGSAVVQLTGVGPARDPTWWPDSMSVVYAASTAAEADLYNLPVSPPGQGATPLVQSQNMQARFSEPHVAPAALAVALVVTVSSRPTAYIAAIGGSAVPLTSITIDDHEIVWSHDSSKLLVVRGNNADRAIWIVRSDGTGLMNLAPGSHPRWSLDDRSILFETVRDGNREVYRMDPDGQNQVNLTRTPYDDFGPEWLSCPAS